MTAPELFAFAKVGDVEVVRGPAKDYDAVEAHLRFPLPTPSGPRKSPPRASANTREAYWAWRRTPEGRAVWTFIAPRAVEATGRVSTKRLVELARGELKVEVNNSYTSFIADELLERWPGLVHQIERRRRKK